ncbi:MULTISPECIES: hypothetical protein [unclassified Pseudomonas]|uniref:hypothetical protein n=1 Tax=unclassified Pseudomonas TaxID=196821 RepID=UPI00215C16CB|nr:MULTISPECIES: hypothetical protein [unclassified Pseudomonas]MCR8932777.1 hypothetical protein [Pseudomonas sp. S11A4]MCR8976382.1 hypothetical protein [Pseudomonas sp. S11P7]
MENGNPAARLLDVLIEAQGLSRTITARQAWSKILDSGTSMALMHERLAKVMNLSEEAFLLVNELFPRQARASQTWKTALDTGFLHQEMNGQFETFIAHLSPTAIDHLTSAADLLEFKTPNKLADTQIQNFIKTLNELIEEVLSGELEQKVREYLARSLRKVIIALEEYRLGGEIPITSSIDALLGHSAFDSEYRSAISETTIGSKILNVLGGISDAVTVATPVVPLLLTESFKNMIVG